MITVPRAIGAAMYKNRAPKTLGANATPPAPFSPRLLVSGGNDREARHDVRQTQVTKRLQNDEQTLRLFMFLWACANSDAEVELNA